MYEFRTAFHQNSRCRASTYFLQLHNCASDVLVPSLVERPVVVGEDGGVNLIDARQAVPLGYDDLGRRVGGSPKSCAPKVADSAVQPRNVG